LDPQSQWLVARWKDGDQDAARELFLRYSERLIALVRNRLSDKLSPRLDAEDVVQSVYRCFFSNARDNRCVLEQSGDLWRLLVTMAMHMLLDQAKRQHAGRRSVQREAGSVDAFPDDFGLNAELLSREPSPDDAVAVLEELELLLRGLDPVHRHIVELRLQGHGTTEIAATVDRSRQMVALVLKRAHERLSQRFLDHNGS
jgi:RNA polymerase sigma-70 factor (ECF subfamily)